jgi:signal transduction histidine kinase/ligand-binding sensor domain-containing protein
MPAGKNMTRNGRLLLLGLASAWLALAMTAHAQRVSNWRVYKKADGLPESACESVTLGLNGKILTTHRRAMSAAELDGYVISNFRLPGTEVLRVSETPSGQLWALTRNRLQEWKDNAWLPHPVPEIAEEFRSGAPRAGQSPSFFPVKQGRVLFLTANGLMDFNAEDSDHPQTRQLRTADPSRLGKFLGLCGARDGGLWISAANGLAKVAGPLRNLGTDAEWREHIVPNSLAARNFREPFEDDDGGIICVAESSTNGQKVIVHFDGENWTALPAGSKNITHAWRGPGKVIWAMTEDSLLALDENRHELRESDELSARQFFDVAVESGGAFWLATSDGLFHYALPMWRSPRPAQTVTSPVNDLAEDSQGRLWLVAGNELHSLEADVHHAYLLPETLAQNPQIARALFPLNDGSLLLATAEKWFQFSPDNRRFSTVPPGKDVARRNAVGLLKDGSFCFQSFLLDANDRDYRLEIFDGRKFQTFPHPTPPPVFGGNFAALFTAQNGDVWLGGEQGIAWLHDGKWRAFPASDKSVPDHAIGFAELADGKIWCAAPDRILEFNGRDWLTVRAGFDHINAILRARDGSVWVGTDGGLHRFLQGAWIENGMEDGLPSPLVRELCEDRRGRIWAGTARGLSLYSPETDADPPQVMIQKLTEKEGDIPEGGTITLAFVGRDKWKYTPGGRLLYSYRLDQHDWTPFLDANSVSFTDLPAGKHYFQVRVMDRNGSVAPSPARLEFAVALLWYHETRLLVIALAGLAVALFFASLSYNRHRRLVHSHAEVERKVAERTRELELANRELLHSQKMNALGTLAAGIAHDFNNILSIIKGSAQIIEDNAGNPQKIRTRVDRIKTVVEQGSGVVNAMLGFSRESDGPPTLCDPNEVVADTLKLLGDRFHREEEVNFKPAEKLSSVRASKDFVQQILLNFIFNAAESMTAQKRIAITARNANSLPADVVLLPGQTGACVLVAVRDFGCGISPENRPRIFEPFFTTKAMSERRGTGLGLSMVYELAKKLGAGLAVESVVDQGSTFTLILPAESRTQSNESKQK